MPSVAVVGASSAPQKYGNKAVRAYLRRGWKSTPSTPRRRRSRGCQSPPGSGMPAGVDRFTLYVPPSVGITLLEAIKSKQPKELYLNPGAESDALVARAEALGLEPILACSIVEIGERP